MIEHDAEAGGSGERTLLGGLKTKAVDVVVTRNGIGPVMAISIKGTLNAFRNLTNRMEEAVGDCTNLHIAYPALVYGFLQVLRANRPGPDVPPNDVAIGADGKVVEVICRYHDVMARLADRADIHPQAVQARLQPAPKWVNWSLSIILPAGLQAAILWQKLVKNFREMWRLPGIS